MPLTDRYTAVSRHIYDLLTTYAPALGLKGVYYGDQEKVPSYPAACVEAGGVARELVNRGGKGGTTNTFPVYVLLYHARIQDVQDTRYEAELLSEEIMDLLHADVHLGGLVMHGFVTRIEPGYAVRGNTLYFATRITWEGRANTLITGEFPETTLLPGTDVFPGSDVYPEA